MKQRIICLDLESRRWAADLNPEDPEAGWDELRTGRGGASAICIYDSLENWLFLYDDNTMADVARHIESADLVIGYCSEKFDIPCIEGLCGKRLRIRRHFDIYVALARALAEQGFRGQKGDLTLDRIAKRNLGRGKIDHGSNAKELARKGHWARLFNYCSSDVRLTYDLYLKLVADGGLLGPRGFISLEVPQ